MKLSKRSFLEIELLALLISFIPVLLIISNDEVMAENWTTSFVFFYESVVGSIFKYIPFSMTEILVVSLVILIVVLLIFLIVDIIKHKKEKIYHIIMSLSLIGCGSFCLYFSTGSIPYYRSNIDIPLYEGTLVADDYVNIINYFTDDYNKCANSLSYDNNGDVINPYTLSELNHIIENDYSKLDSTYFNSFTTYAKPMMSSYIYREFNITGLTFTPLGESSIDYLICNAEYPFTIAHELAHAKGVMREEDAQLTAMYITLNSDNEFVRYSGYVYTFSSIRNLSNYMSSAQRETLHPIDNKISKNLSYISKYYSDHNLLLKISTFFNNLYLSMHNDGGVQSYVDVPEDIDNEGTEEEPVWIVSSYSRYQKLYFHIYFK
jgi:hypothetical protein